MTPYFAYKLVHVLSATILLGTGIGIAFFAWFGYRHALRTGAIDGLRAVLRLTVLADAWFTAPAVVVQFLTGLRLVALNHWALTSPWSVAAIGLFVAVGAFWLPVVVIQIRLRRAAEQAPSIAALGGRFHREFRIWFALGVPAFTLVVALFYLMVLKPLAVR